MGFDNELNTSLGALGESRVFGFTSTNDGLFHQLVGKLEINASGANERLTVWIDPTGVETANRSASRPTS